MLCEISYKAGPGRLLQVRIASGLIGAGGFAFTAPLRRGVFLMLGLLSGGE